MKTMNMNKWRMCCCCNSMHMMNSEKRIKVYIFNKYKKRQNHEENSIYNSIVYRSAA